MGSSGRSRKIASNLLWTAQGVLRHPLVEFSDDGSVVGISVCPEPDRTAFVEFRSGLLVADFPADFRAVFDALPPDRPLSESLPPLLTPGRGVWVVISGLDYRTLSLTPAARIEKV